MCDSMKCSVQQSGNFYKLLFTIITNNSLDSKLTLAKNNILSRKLLMCVIRIYILR